MFGEENPAHKGPGEVDGAGHGPFGRRSLRVDNCIRFADVLHVDILAHDPLTTGVAPPRLIKRTTEDDPTIGGQVRSGWATYVSMSEPHTMADCPFKAGD